MERLLLRPSEAAQVIGVSRSKVYELLSEGVLPAIRLGRVVRVPLEALRRWVAERTTSSTDAA